jgi:uncharacterized OsmC-like protein
MLRMTVNRAECRVEVDYYLKGSVLKETIESGATGCRVHFVVDSPETSEDIERVIRLAKRGCYAERLVETPVKVTSTYEVNGVVADLPPDG